MTTQVKLNQLDTTVYNSNIFLQALVNGNFDVWTKGTSIAWGTSVYAPDRWLFVTGSGQAGTITQQDGTGVAGSRFSMRVQRTSGQLASNNEIYYAMESVDSIKLRGKKLTLSFWAKCGANFSPTSSLLPVAIVTGKGTDQKVASFTTSANAIAENKVLTTSVQKFTVTTTAVIASDITQIGLRFSNYTTGTAGANDWFEIEQVQLCAGDVALPFQPKSEEEETLSCQRWLYEVTGGITTSYQSYAPAHATSTTNGYASILFPVKMRIPPTLLSLTPGNFSFGYSGGGNVALTNIVIGVATNKSAFLTLTAASGLTANMPGLLYATAAASPMYFSAEI
jgi:hypothetical protein